MDPQSSRERSHGLLAVSAKVIKPKIYQPKHNAPRPPARSCRLVSKIDAKHRQKIQYLASQIFGEEIFACVKFRPYKDDVIFRKPDTVCEWRICQQDIITFPCEDSFGDKKLGDTKRRGPAFVFGAVSKAKLDESLSLEVKAVLGHKQAILEAHQKRLGYQKKCKVSEQTIKMCFGGENLKEEETSSGEAMEIE